MQISASRPPQIAHAAPPSHSGLQSGLSEPTPLLNKTFFAAQNWGSAGKIRRCTGEQNYASLGLCEIFLTPTMLDLWGNANFHKFVLGTFGTIILLNKERAPLQTSIYPPLTRIDNKHGIVNLPMGVGMGRAREGPRLSRMIELLMKIEGWLSQRTAYRAGQKSCP